MGLPAATIAARALHGLTARFVVLVPAGIVVLDRLTLADPVLFTREHVRGIRALPTARAPRDVLDLRLGATAGGMSLTLDEDADLMRAARGRRGGAMTRTRELWVAVVRREELFREAAERRLRVIVS